MNVIVLYGANTIFDNHSIQLNGKDSMDYDLAAEIGKFEKIKCKIKEVSL